MAVYLIFVIVSLLIGSGVKKKHFGIYIFLVSLGLAILAYHIDVHPESDLVNHFNRIGLFRSNQITLLSVLNRVNIGTHFVYWVFSFFPNSVYFVAVSVFICYYLMLRLAYNVCQDNDAPKAMYLLCVMVIFTCYNFYIMVNSIRFWVGFSVFFYLLYEEVVRKKNKILIWIGYVFLVLFHYGTLIFIAGRILGLLYTGIKRGSKKVWLFIIFCGICLLCFMASSYFQVHVINKIEGYSSYNKRGTWQTIVGFARIITVTGFIFHAFKKVHLNYQEYFIVVLFISVIPFLLFTNYTLILRFGDAVITTASVAIITSSRIDCYPKSSLEKMPLLSFILYMCMVLCFMAFLVFDYRNLIFNF